MITLFGGLLLSSEILPSGVFSMFTFEPLSMFFTAMAFGAGIFSLPLLNTFAMFACAVFFFTIFPYIINDKFIFPKDPRMRPYSGLDFIRKNISYRWETILFAWLIIVANITKSTFDTKEDLKAKVIKTNGLEAKVRFDSGSELQVKTNELSIDPDSYLTVNSRVEVNTNSLGISNPLGAKIFGVIRGIDTIKGEVVYTVEVSKQIKNPDMGVPTSNKKTFDTFSFKFTTTPTPTPTPTPTAPNDSYHTSIEKMTVSKSQITPIIDYDNKQKIRKDSRVIVNSKSTAGSIASLFIYLIAFGWLIWIIFKHKATYVVLSIVLFVTEFLVDHQVIISLIILLGIGLYFGIMYKDEVVDVANDITDKATKIKVDDIRKGVVDFTDKATKIKADEIGEGVTRMTKRHASEQLKRTLAGRPMSGTEMGATIAADIAT